MRKAKLNAEDAKVSQRTQREVFYAQLARCLRHLC